MVSSANLVPLSSNFYPTAPSVHESAPRVGRGCNTLSISFIEALQVPINHTSGESAGLDSAGKGKDKR